jgi:hypothetical protein
MDHNVAKTAKMVSVRKQVKKISKVGRNGKTGKESALVNALFIIHIVKVCDFLFFLTLKVWGRLT